MDTLKLTLFYDQPILATIRARYSVRSYQPFPIPENEKNTLKLSAAAFSSNTHRFEWFESKPGDILVERLGTYGFIKGAHAFLVGILPKIEKHNQQAGMHFGYDFEQLILKSTQLGLGTCWLGGTFNPSTFARSVNLQPGEKIVMVSPVGFGAGTRHFVHDISMQVAKSRLRIAWEKLFFYGDLSHPLSEKEAGPYAEVLEMVRVAPSAVNTQPWRIIRDDRGFHFYGAETYYYRIRKVDFLRNNDVGIAMSHFELACRELGLAGSWKQVEEIPIIHDLTYFASWVPSVNS